MKYINHIIKHTGHIEILEEKEGKKNGYVIAPNESIEKYNEEIEADPDFEKYRTQENSDAYEQMLEELKPTPEEIAEQEARRQREIDKVEFPKLREKKLVQLLGDQVEIEDEREEKAFAEVYPDWEIGKDYAVNDRVTYNGKIVKVIQAHTSQADWTPDVSSSLFSYLRPESEEIPLWSDFESHEFQQMELGTLVKDQGKVYELTDPAQGHRKPSGEHGHFGWSEV